MFDVGYDTLVTEEAMTRKTAMTAKAKSTTGATSQTAKTTKATAPKEKAKKPIPPKNSVNSPDKKPSADKNADTKFPGFQKRNIAGENVSVKKIGEFGFTIRPQKSATFYCQHGTIGERLCFTK